MTNTDRGVPGSSPHADIGRRDEQPDETRFEPAIHYWGTPVVLVSTQNPDGTANLAPMSSGWWLGWSCMLGFDATSRTVENLRRTGECVLNLPDATLAPQVDRLARTTGSDPMPAHKAAMGYESVADKFGRAGFTPVRSETVAPPRAAECPVQLEAAVTAIGDFGVRDHRLLIPAVAVEVTIRRVHAHPDIRSTRFHNRIDPGRWDPLLMSFLEYKGTRRVDQTSGLRQVDEEFYAGRSPRRITQRATR
ncbi:flavin reductase family protein [Dactylosporangium sp. NPDC005572]|uniref:flavin reductase family protein n=1 Tax=Dactylosporangium sp. NPDC005572 TaxID=3156889 RepID=UPI0033A339BA